ncbi:MAG: hypothetical protein HY909_05215 [Deltaproteobacteria bacterium]|nr:hypothetical protein [Deltaproteobacteria bacterium]
MSLPRASLPPATSPSNAPRPPSLPNLRYEEGEALRVLESLLGASGAVSLKPDLALPEVRPALLEVGADRIRRAVLRFLTDEGGFRERQFLRDGTRVTGRVWDSHLGEGLQLRYTYITEALWIGLTRVLPGLQGKAQAPERKAPKNLRELVPPGAAGTGDWVFLALADGNLGALTLPQEERVALQRKLRAVSPLAALFALEADAPQDELQGFLLPLTERPASRLVECLEERLAARWLQVLGRAYRTWEEPARLVARWTTHGRVLRAWLGALDQARRMDLARPLLRAAAALSTEVFPGGGDAVRQRLSATLGLRNLREREDLLAAVAAVVGVGTELLRERELLGQERYGDDRYDEAQVYLRDVQTTLAPSRRGLEELTRALANTLG